MKHLMFVIFVFFFSCSLEKKSASQVLARVNNYALTANDLEELLPPGRRTENQINRFINEWVESMILYDAAVKVGLNKDRILLASRDRFYEKILGSSFIKTQTQGKVMITEDDIRDYYQKNKNSFYIETDEAIIRHFLSPSLKEARAIKKTLTGGREKEKTAELFTKYSVETKTVKRGHLTKNLDMAIFTAKGKNIIGPITSAGSYHIIDILRIKNRGSQRGLEDVYDEIYQRLSKERDAVLVREVIDSLYAASSVFISPNIQAK